MFGSIAATVPNGALVVGAPAPGLARLPLSYCTVWRNGGLLTIGKKMLPSGRS
jgi:hypothetical protein